MASHSKDTMNLLFVGPSGVGKTDSCCTIFGDLNFGQDNWKVGQSVKSSSTATKLVRGCDLTIVDTPGLYETDDNDSAVSEIRDSFKSVPYGFTSIVLVVRMGRISQETEKSILLIREIFGNKCLDFITVIFTHKDQLQKGRNTMSVDEFICGLRDNELKRLLNDCNNRFVAFDNTQVIGSSACLQQIEEFLKMVKNLAAMNGSYMYTRNMMDASDATQQIRDKANRDRKLPEVRPKMRTNIGDSEGDFSSPPAYGKDGNGNGGFWINIWKICRKHLWITMAICVVGVIGLLRLLNNQAFLKFFKGVEDKQED